MDKFIIRSCKNDKPVPVPSTSNQKKDIAPIGKENFDPPKDIAPIGENITQIKLSSYPRNKDGRCFRKEWYEKFSWIEYSPSRDAVFCYACRQFLPHASKENFFTSIGFKNWKTALDKSKGFQKHDSSQVHISAMALWTEKNIRLTTSHEVSTLVNNEVLERNRYYITSIAEIIQFLAVNELSMRGTYSIELHEEQGLFKNLFEFTLKKDEKLRKYSQSVPRNATYLSPEIQNDVIQILSDCVRESIVEDVKNADVPWYTILADGTKDRKGNENFAIGIRYVKDGIANEATLCIKTTTELDAKSLTDLILNTLKENGLNTDNILSQCYDGASVMSGKRGGVQSILQQRLNRTIPYVHCCNHRLHLVIVKAINDVSVIKQFFEQCAMLYMFLKRGCVAKNYEGHSLSRLLEQRWSGHLDVTDIIYSNYREIVKVLNLVSKSGTYDGADVTEANGLYAVVTKRKFRFCVVFMRRILKTIEPADKQMQARETSLNDCSNIIEAVTECLKSMRTSESYEEVDKYSSTGAFEVGNTSKCEPPAKRRKLPSSSLRDFITMETTGRNQNSESLKQIFMEVIDIILMEIDRRFRENTDLLHAISAAEELDYKNISYLASLGIGLPSKEELTVVKSYLEKSGNFGDVFQKIFKQKEAFEDTYKLLATSRTFGCSTALCESTFSVLTRIDRAQRLSMTHQRLANLVFLAFEKKRTKNIDFQKFLRKFNDMKSRKIQLF